MLQGILSEVTNLWFYVYGIMAGWGLSFTAVVAFLVLAHMKIAKLENDLRRYHSQMVAETRDASLRLNKLEK